MICYNVSHSHNSFHVHGQCRYRYKPLAVLACLIAIITLGNYIQSYSITLVKVINFIFNLYSNCINNQIYGK